MKAVRVLDLFCGAGLVADGLLAAGFDVCGVDLYPKRNYPGPFIQHDALTLDMRFVRSFDAIWASPPCLRDTAMRHAKHAKKHPDLISPTRALLEASGLPYVIENVETAPLIDPVTLCGSMFDLGAEVDGRTYHLKRHRKFETNWPLRAPRPCEHRKPVVTVLGGHARVRAASAGGRGTADFVGCSHRDVMGWSMGVLASRKITCTEISDGIPPAYAAYVGLRLRAHLATQERAAA